MSVRIAAFCRLGPHAGHVVPRLGGRRGNGSGLSGVPPGAAGPDRTWRTGFGVRGRTGIILDAAEVVPFVRLEILLAPRALGHAGSPRHGPGAAPPGRSSDAGTGASGVWLVKQLPTPTNRRLPGRGLVRSGFDGGCWRRFADSGRRHRTVAAGRCSLAGRSGAPGSRSRALAVGGAERSGREAGRVSRRAAAAGSPRAASRSAGCDHLRCGNRGVGPSAPVPAPVHPWTRSWTTRPCGYPNRSPRATRAGRAPGATGTA